MRSLRYNPGVATPSAERSTLRVVTRGSQLALIQTGMVVDALAARWPEVTFEIVTASTPGDRDKQTPLTTLGQGVFVKGVEEQLLDGRVDLAVHSLKDVPTDETPGLTLGAFPLRADASTPGSPCFSSVRELPCWASPPGAAPS